MNVQNRQAWLDERRTGVGGSDIAAILGLSPWATPYTVWLDKLGRGEEVDPESPPLYWGNVLEDVVAKEYQRRSGRKVQRVNRAIVHPEVKIARCNIDRAVINPDIAGNVRWKDGRLTTDRILECKTANGFMAKFWGDEATDAVPEYYLTQCVWNAGIAQAKVCDLPVLIGGQDFRTYSIDFDGDLFADMLSEAEEFWKLVESGVAPDPQTVEDAKHRWARHLDAKTEIVGVDCERAADRLHEIAAQVKALEAEKKAHQLTIMAAMEDAEIANHAGRKLATWKTQEATRIDAKALRAAHPDIADLFSTTTASRVFRLGAAPKE